MKIELRKRAIALRKQGMTISEIKRFVPVSKSSISLWIQGLELSPDAKKRISERSSLALRRSNETIFKKTKLKIEEAEEFARLVISKIRLNKSMNQILCSSIYECEGGKGKSGVLSFTNSDPMLIKVFLRLLRESFVLNESKFRVCLHLHNYHNPKIQTKFWSKTTCIPENQFMKPFIKKNSGLYKKEGYQGCVSIRYYDISVKRKLQMIFNKFYSSFEFKEI